MDESLRAADRDRDRVAEALCEHYAQGRLTMEEFDERTTAAASAKTLGELRTLTADLPSPPDPSDAHGRQERAWTPTQMRCISVAGIVATVAVVALLAVFGRFFLAVPTWLFILVAIRLLHGRRRMPGARGPRVRRG